MGNRISIPLVCSSRVSGSANQRPPIRESHILRMQGVSSKKGIRELSPSNAINLGHRPINEIWKFLLTQKDMFLRMMNQPEFEQFIDQMIALAKVRGETIDRRGASNDLWARSGGFKEINLYVDGYKLDITARLDKESIHKLMSSAIGGDTFWKYHWGAASFLGGEVNSAITRAGRWDPEPFDQCLIKEIDAIAGTTPTLLDLSSCKLTKLPDSVKALHGLKYLNLNNNPDLFEIDMNGFPNLEVLLMSGTIRRVFPQMQGLTNLKTLDVSNRFVQDIQALENMTSLENLNLSNNHQLTDLSVLDTLPNLRVLDVSNTKIANVSFLNSLKNLVSLDISQGFFRDFKYIRDFTPLVQLEQLVHLRMTTPLGGSMIKVRGGLYNLEELDIKCDYGIISLLSPTMLPKLKVLNCLIEESEKEEMIDVVRRVREARPWLQIRSTFMDWSY